MMKVIISVLLVLVLALSACAVATEGEASRALKKDPRTNTKLTKPAELAPPTTITKQLNIGDNLNSKFGQVLTSTNFGGLKKLTYTVPWRPPSAPPFRALETIEFPNTNNPVSVQTGLSYSSNRQEDWGDYVFVPAESGSMKYFLELVDVPESYSYNEYNPWSVPFAGKNLDIVDYQPNNKLITVKLGKTYHMIAGDTVIVDGEEITFVKANGGNTTTYENNSAQLLVEANGTNQTGNIQEGMTVTINGLPITVTNIFNDDGTEFDAATIMLEDNNTNNSFVINNGESVVFNGYVITLLNVQGSPVISNSPEHAVFTSNGITDAVKVGSVLTLSNLKVQPLGIKNKEGVENDVVTVIIAKGDTIKTFKDGDYFIGEDPDNPAWVWDFSRMNQNIIGVKWALNIDDTVETENPMYEHPLYEGESYKFPNDYVKVKFEGVTVNDYVRYEVDTVTKDLVGDNNSNNTVYSAKVIRIRCTGLNNCLILGEPTDTIYLRYVDENSINLYRKESGSTRAVFEKTGFVGGTLFQLNYVESLVDVVYNSNETNSTLLFEFSNNDKVSLYLESSRGAYEYIGHSDSDTVTWSDVLYYGEGSGAPGAGMGVIDISGWEENTITAYGVIIESYAYSAASDTFSFSLPSKRMQASISLIGNGASSPSEPNQPTVKDVKMG